MARGHLDDFERVAIVTDIGWVRSGVTAFGVFMPCPVRLFHLDELEEAKAWVRSPVSAAAEVRVERDGESACVHARVTGALSLASEDELLQALIEGIGDAERISVVLEAGDFHGWRDFNAFWRHFRFVHAQRKKIERVALVGDARWQKRLLGTARRAMGVDARFFDQSHLAEARVWATPGC